MDGLSGSFGALQTAYPRFKRLPSARELHVFYTPQPGEVAWARGVAGSAEHQ